MTATGVFRHLARWGRRALMLAGGMFFVIMATPLVPWWARWQSPRFEEPAGDVLVVFGAAGESDGALLDGSFWRCVYAARAWRQGSFERILVSGGAPDGQQAPVAQAMKTYLVAMGVPAGVIETEDRALTTRENALYCAPRITGKRAVLVTSDYHMKRALAALRKAGVQAASHAAPDAVKRAQVWHKRWSVTVDLATESLKTARYRWKGWTE